MVKTFPENLWKIPTSPPNLWFGLLLHNRFLFFSSGGSCWEEDDSFVFSQGQGGGQTIYICQEVKHLEALLLPHQKKQSHRLKFDKSKEGLGGLGTQGCLLSIVTIVTISMKHMLKNRCLGLTNCYEAFELMNDLPIVPFSLGSFADRFLGETPWALNSAETQSLSMVRKFISPATSSKRT